MEESNQELLKELTQKRLKKQNQDNQTQEKQKAEENKWFEEKCAEVVTFEEEIKKKNTNLEKLMEEFLEGTQEIVFKCIQKLNKSTENTFNNQQKNALNTFRNDDKNKDFNSIAIKTLNDNWGKEKYDARGGLQTLLEEIFCNDPGDLLKNRSKLILEAAMKVIENKIAEEKNQFKITFQMIQKYVFDDAISIFKSGSSMIHVALFATQIIKNFETICNPNATQEERHEALESNTAIAQSLEKSLPMSTHLLITLGVMAAVMVFLVAAPTSIVAFAAWIQGVSMVQALGISLALYFKTVAIIAAGGAGVAGIVSFPYRLVSEYKDNTPARQLAKFGAFPEAAENKSDAKTVNDFNVNSDYVLLGSN